MAYYKEIVTKAIIGKGKKTTDLNHTVLIDNNINTVLGCWVINHVFNGTNNNGKIFVNGSYDINIWYSYDNNTKTNVIVKTFNYQDVMNIRLKENSDFTNTSEIIVRALSQPSVVDVKLNDNKIELSVHKELGVEVVGDTTVRVSVDDEFEDYEEILDDNDSDKEKNVENFEINENYLE